LGLQPKDVRALVDRWLHVEPLATLSTAAAPGVQALFSRIRHSGRKIGILSDYPAEAKLAALGLSADFIVHAEQETVGILKPHPAGLRHLLSLASVSSSEAVFIGDRPDRDGEAGRRAGVATYIVGARGVAPWRIRSFNDLLVNEK
jgi:FMN phosphatase YigB (HAD superfamily)